MRYDESEHPKTTIGWVEYVDFPAWEIHGIKAKADTGARTSALDVTNLVEIGEDIAQFDVVLSRRDRSRRVRVEAPIVRRSSIRSSLGHPHDRLIVAVAIRIGPVEKTIELGLVNRKNMRCRMLLGRKTLEEDFLVDPARAYIFGKKRKKGAKLVKPKARKPEVSPVGKHGAPHLSKSHVSRELRSAAKRHREEKA